MNLHVAKDAFLINYTIKEGQQYNFSEINFDISDVNIDKNSLIKLNRIKRWKRFDQRRIPKLLEEIDIFLTKMVSILLNLFLY